MSPETDPSAEIFIDGVSQGLADSRGVLVIRAKVGAHALRISQPGKKTFDQTFRLIDEQPLPLAKPRSSGLTNSLKSPGASPAATIWLDNTSRGIVDGTSEIHLSGLQAGPHALRLSMTGKVDDSRTVVVAAAGRTLGGGEPSSIHCEIKLPRTS